MILTRNNYFSFDAGKEYMSVSQFKSLVPEYGGCELAGMAQIKGLYEPPKKEAFLEGLYLHAWQENNLETFKANNPDLYSGRGATVGQLKSNFQHCNTMIETLESDPLVMMALGGKKEVIFTAEMFGIRWKIMIDSYQPEFTAERGMLADLKAIKSLSDKFWNARLQLYENFIEHYGYNIQMSVYAEVEKKATGRENWLMPHIVAVTKETPPDHEIIYFEDSDIAAGLNIVAKHIERVKQVKNGEVDPIPCGKCAYCRSVKKIKSPKHYSEFSLY